jgi:hypothetical protein
MTTHDTDQAGFDDDFEGFCGAGDWDWDENSFDNGLGVFGGMGNSGFGGGDNKCGGWNDGG